MANKIEENNNNAISEEGKNLEFSESLKRKVYINEEISSKRIRSSEDSNNHNAKKSSTVDDSDSDHKKGQNEITPLKDIEGVNLLFTESSANEAFKCTDVHIKLDPVSCTLIENESSSSAANQQRKTEKLESDEQLHQTGKGSDETSNARMSMQIKSEPDIVEYGASNSTSHQKVKVERVENNEQLDSSITSDEPSNSTAHQKIKVEPDENNEQLHSSITSDEPSNSGTSLQIKSEPLYNNDDIDSEAVASTEEPGSSHSNTNILSVITAVKVEIADATSSTSSRPTCKFGIKCFRRNPLHRVEEAHPGDSDYKRPVYPLPPLGTPSCPYGNSCYRRNPIHFQSFSHPPDTDFNSNFNARMLRRRTNRNLGNGNDSSEDSADEDPFNDDAAIDSDYVPNTEELKEDSEEENIDGDDEIDDDDNDGNNGC